MYTLNICSNNFKAFTSTQFDAGHFGKIFFFVNSYEYRGYVIMYTYIPHIV